MKKNEIITNIKNKFLKFKYLFKHLNNIYKNDKDVVLAAVNKNGYVLDYASEELKNNKELLLATVKKNGKVLEYASNKLKNDKDLFLIPLIISFLFIIYFS